MRAFSFIAVLAIGAVLVLYGQQYFQNVIEWLIANALADRLGPSWGVASSFTAAFVSFIYVLVTQNFNVPGMVRRYRWAEEELMRQGKMRQEEILAYHRSYNWHSYAGLGFAIVFIIVPLFISREYDSLSAEQRAVILIGLGCVGISTVLLGAADLFHTNSLTPLITSDRRFVFMDLILKVGWTAMLLQICAVGVFLSLISSYLSFVTSGLGLLLMVLITNIRGVPIKSIARERELSEEQAKRVDAEG